ncbi:MAG: hypothetical protein ACOZCL_10830 [Bacillota bacterium]
MKISASEITMTSQHSYVEEHIKSEKLHFWTGQSPPKPAEQDKDIGVLLEISQESRYLLAESTMGTESISSEEDPLDKLTDKERLKVMLIEEFFRHFLRKKVKIRLIDMDRLRTMHKDTDTTTVLSAKPLGWGLSYDYHESHYENEKVSFSAKGVVKTQDGREIRLNVDIKASREFLSQSSLSIRAGDAVLKDPLVINYNSTSFNITDKKFSFDIDSDGTLDQISFAGDGSGFLSLDVNNDGIINNGSELFGTSSGDGFADLAEYDTDSNGWIDENDPVFERLRIWSKDSEGKDYLFALGEKGIGAVYLGNTSTEFSLKNGDITNGVARKTGIFLRENGSAGTIQHIDIAI